LDPHSGLGAVVLDNGTSSPLVAPDGEVYFGVLGSPNQDSRGYLLHFHANLQTNGPPGAFGWDNTPAIVPTNMVPSYTGTSPYLILPKYNNYAGNGDGVTRIAVLDPYATQIDPPPIASRLVEMREILTVIGPTPDSSYQSTNYPYAVREWCLNTAAVNPPT